MSKETHGQCADLKSANNELLHEASGNAFVNRLWTVFRNLVSGLQGASLTPVSRGLLGDKVWTCARRATG